MIHLLVRQVREVKTHIEVVSRACIFAAGQQMVVQILWKYHVSIFRRQALLDREASFDNLRCLMMDRETVWTTNPLDRRFRKERERTKLILSSIKRFVRSFFSSTVIQLDL